MSFELKCLSRKELIAHDPFTVCNYYSDVLGSRDNKFELLKDI